MATVQRADFLNRDTCSVTNFNYPKNRMTIQTQNNRMTQNKYSEKIGPKK